MLTLIVYVHVELHHVMVMNFHHSSIINYQFYEIIEKDYLYEQRFLMHFLIDKDIDQIFVVFLKQKREHLFKMKYFFKLNIPFIEINDEV